MTNRERLKRIAGRKPSTTPHEDWRHQVRVALIGTVLLAGLVAAKSWGMQ